MVTKELIKALQTIDPDGTTEVCVDNLDIYYVEIKQAYWDGRLERIITDPNVKGYNVIGAKVLASGNKVNLITMGVEEVLCNNPDAPIDLSDLEKRMPGSATDWNQRIKNWREEFKDI